MSSLLYDLALSPFYDRLVQLWPLWVHPNAITCLGGAGAAASLLAMRRGSWVAACAAFTAYHMLDNMDGKQARRTGKSSRLGHVLDHALDGSLGVLASCQICCDHLFGYPAAQRFALCCGMSTLLTCHVAERCSGRPTLGTRLFGADELFLLCSLSLGHRAATGEPLLQLDGSERERWWPALRAGWLLAVALLAVLTVRRPRWLAALGSFGLLCATAPWPLPCLVYGPALAVLLVTNAARAPRPCLACSRSSAHSSTRTRAREYPPSSRTHTRGPGSARS